MSSAAELAVRRVRWKAACRIVPTRYPTIYLYDRVASAEDFDALYALEALTNDRIRDEQGEVALVPYSSPISLSGNRKLFSGSIFGDSKPWRTRFIWASR